MKLYHFSNNDFKILKPSFFGQNFYTRNEKNVCNLPRAFCYDTPEAAEHTLSGSNFRYTLEIDSKKIYDLDKDNLKLKEAYNFDIDRLLIFLRKFYLGASYTTSFKCYCLFKAAKVTKQERIGGVI